MKEKEIEDELISIRSMMERSSKFISLSGLSGILAGVYALIGDVFAYLIIANPFILPKVLALHVLPTLLSIAMIVLIASIVTGVILSAQKAKRNGQQIWSKTSRLLLFYMATPIITGGIVILILINQGYYGIIAPASLIFYGLSLVSASSYTFSVVKYLGLCEIILGLIAACLPEYGLLFWAIGFGVLHIVYGSMMYFKYDR